MIFYLTVVVRDVDVCLEEDAWFSSKADSDIILNSYVVYLIYHTTLTVILTVGRTRFGEQIKIYHVWETA